MALWEYKVISSGKGGFATPAHLEKFLNDLGKDEWEIIDFRAQPDNALAFSGLARRTTQRDWTLEDAAAAAARTEADKLRAEFEAKFRSATAPAPAGEAAERPESTGPADKPGTDDGLRRLRDTERDLDPDAPDEEPKDEWDLLKGEDELPTFFEALRPHLRRNQRGPGMSVGVDFLAKKWDLAEEDIKAALVECGFVMPADENSRAEYLEYEGDLYWVNINRRGELWINTKEKPRPVFRVVAGQRVAPETVEEMKPEDRGPRTEDGAQAPEAGREGREDNGQGRQGRGRNRDREPREAQPDVPGEPLPAGPELLDRIRPHMRRNRRGPGGAGSTSFLARALKCREADLVAAFHALGLVEPAPGEADPAPIEIGDGLWFLNRDQRGGLWINGRLKSEPAGESPESPSESAPAPAGDAPAPAEATPSAAEIPGTDEPDEEAADAAPAATLSPAASELLTSVRPHLQETKTGSFAAEISSLAKSVNREEADLVASLTEAGLKVPEKARERPVYVPHGSEIFWFNRNAKDEIWVNAKVSKFSRGDGDDGEKKSRRPRTRKQES